VAPPLLVAAAEVVLAVLLAPVLLGCVPAAVAVGRSATDLHRLTFLCSFSLMPVAIGALAWFAAWRLPVAPSGPAGQPVAIVIGVLFAVQSLVVFYFLAVGAAMGGALGKEPPVHPRWFAYRGFCSCSYAVLLLNLPLALIVAIIRLLA
jgi:hypothetical protein